MPQADGVKSRCRLVTTMTKRSTHMPMLTASATKNRAMVLVRMFFDQSSLRNENVEQHQRPKNPAIRPERAIGHHVFFKNVAAIPRHERFHHIAVRDHHSGDEHDDRHVVQVARGDEIFQAVKFADRNDDIQHHREAGINRARRQNTAEKWWSASRAPSRRQNQN